MKGWHAKVDGRWHEVTDVVDSKIPAHLPNGGNTYHLKGLGPVHQSKIEDLAPLEDIEDVEPVEKAWTDHIPGGLADKKEPSDFPKKALEQGKRVESEHTSDKKIATEISMDHLSEDPQYYKKLQAMEKTRRLHVPPELVRGARSPSPLEKAHNPDLHSLANEYRRSVGMAEVPPPSYHLPDMIDKDRSMKIAQAFHEMPHQPGHPDVRNAYNALARETVAQLEHLHRAGYKFSPIQPGQANPYANSEAMANDVRQNKHLWYFPTEQGFGSDDKFGDHPLNSDVETSMGRMKANDAFRAVHDVFGHVVPGVGFGPRGEEAAYRHHMTMFSPDAQKALTTETRGQNSWVNFDPHAHHNRTNPDKTIFADQKAGLLPDWAHHSADLQKSEPMEKGSRQSRMPFDPQHEGDRRGADPISMWQHVGWMGVAEKNKIPRAEGNLRARILDKISGSAETRRNPETGKREFLLHRMMSESELKKTVKGRIASAPKVFKKDAKVYSPISSWSVSREGVEKVADDARERGTTPASNYTKMVSAWVPEDHVHHMPMMLGNVNKWGRWEKGQNKYAGEKEVLLSPDHKSIVHAVSDYQLHPQPMEKAENEHGLTKYDLGDGYTLHHHPTRLAVADYKDPASDILDSGKETPAVHTWAIRHNGDVVGFVNASPSGDSMRVSGSKVHSAHRGQGLGRKAYAKLAEHYGGLMSDYSRTPEATKAWQGIGAQQTDSGFQLPGNPEKPPVKMTKSFPDILPVRPKR